MTYYAGPESYRNKLKAVYESVESNFPSYAKLVVERSDRLDNAFGHFMTLVVQTSKGNAPVLSVFVDSEGRGFVGLSNSSPFETASALYRFSNEEEEPIVDDFSSVFEEGAELVFHRAIFQSPLKLYFLAYFGNERLLRKEILKDSLRGKDYFRLPEMIDDALFSICRDNYRRWIEFDDGEVLIFPFQNILKIAFGPPKINESIDRSIILELSRLFRIEVTKKCGVLRNASVTPNMKIARPVSTVFEIDLVESKPVYDRLEEFYKFYSKFISETVDKMLKFIHRDFPLDE
ncbi:DUF4895 domain-containing protein [Mesotoga sp.]|uniref:DUF4895 domain-containing protein n=1 Tax=Mesotoga sp. TaxID=2053577 RepID=UPI001BD46F0B